MQHIREIRTEGWVWKAEETCSILPITVQSIKTIFQKADISAPDTVPYIDYEYSYTVELPSVMMRAYIIH